MNVKSMVNGSRKQDNVKQQKKTRQSHIFLSVTVFQSLCYSMTSLSFPSNITVVVNFNKSALVFSSMKKTSKQKVFLGIVFWNKWSSERDWYWRMSSYKIGYSPIVRLLKLMPYQLYFSFYRKSNSEDEWLEKPLSMKPNLGVFAF